MIDNHISSKYIERSNFTLSHNSLIVSCLNAPISLVSIDLSRNCCSILWDYDLCPRDRLHPNLWIHRIGYVDHSESTLRCVYQKFYLITLTDSMTLFFSLLPLYLFGNIHCLGMCGPLVMLIGQHRYRLFYFVGRLLSFSLAGMVAGEAGAVLHVFLKQYYLAEIVSLFCGMLILGWGIQKLMGWQFIQWAPKKSSLSTIHRWISTLLLKDTGWSTFLFGFFTVALPCGQTLIVFSACALVGDPWIGLGNGFALALLTSPSLFVAMHTLSLFKNLKQYDRAVLGGCSILVGLLAICRGLAEIGWISHWILNPEAPAAYHLVVY